MHLRIQAAMQLYNHLVIKATSHPGIKPVNKQANSIKKPEKEGGGPKVLSGAFVVEAEARETGKVLTRVTVP